MRSFEDIYAIAADGRGGRAALEHILAASPSWPAEDISILSDDLILAEMTRRIFSAGFSAKVIDAKWPGFERAFLNFDVDACAFMSDDHLAELLHDSAIVRNGPKIRSVALNAQFIASLRNDYGGGGRFFAEWPDNDYVGLLAILKSRASHLGGETAGRFLRATGKPAFILTRDVVLALIREGVVDRAPTSKRDLLAAQGAFNRWSAESGRDLTQISRVLAMSVGV
jgi:3-methyladenine DNA glycosylase Tag